METQNLDFYVTMLTNDLIESGKLDFIRSMKTYKEFSKNLLKWSKINKKIYNSFILNERQIEDTLQFARKATTVLILKELVSKNKVNIIIKSNGDFGYRLTNKKLQKRSPKTITTL